MLGLSDLSFKEDSTTNVFELMRKAGPGSGMAKKMKAALARRLKPHDGTDNLALLGAAAQPQEEAADHSGAIIGTSLAVFGAAAAIFAARRCQKKDNDFERVN